MTISQEGGSEFGPDFLWRWSPWLQIYVAAAAFRLGGLTTFAGRLPFALMGLACIFLVYQLVGQAVLDLIDERHKSVLPPDVWGDDDPDGVNGRAAEALKDSARAAQRLGIQVVNGFTGSSIWHLLYSFPPVTPKMIERGFQLLAERFHPILDVFAECGVKFALEVHPTEIAFDVYTAERAVEALGGKGFLVENPDDIRPALEEGFAADAPVCINVMTDPKPISPGSIALAMIGGVDVSKFLKKDA